jgi:hypothetical protein
VNLLNISQDRSLQPNISEDYQYYHFCAFTSAHNLFAYPLHTPQPCLTIGVGVTISALMGPRELMFCMQTPLGSRHRDASNAAGFLAVLDG